MATVPRAATALRPLTPLRPAARLFSSSPTRPADFAHIVVGAGAVGLATARSLQARGPTLLLERHATAGTETSSRNSEVIHAGLYYGADSLKTRLCLAGKRMLYALADKHRIPHMNCGKWIVAQDDAQRGEVAKVHDFARSIGVPTRWVSPDEAARREPDVRCAAGALESTTTGILDSHAYMQFLQGSYEEAGGECAFSSSVSGIERDGGQYRVHVGTGADATSVTADVLVNSAGLGAVAVSNMLLPPDRHRKAYYAKGSYYSYGARRPRPSTLIYPAPMPGHGGLGTHLTLDMAGRVRFGPDLQWVDDPADLRVNDQGLAQALDDIQTYLPGLVRGEVQLDYAGIRPKLSASSSATSGKGFVDFYIEREAGFDGFVNLLGIESPGLTSSLAIGDHVRELVYGS